MLRSRTALLIPVAVAALAIVVSGSAATGGAASVTTIATATSLDYRA